MKSIKDNSGATMLFVLALLVVVGFIGNSLIKMSHSDAITHVYYASNDRSNLAASNASYIAISKMTKNKTDPDVVNLLTILNEYVGGMTLDTTFYLVGDKNNPMIEGNASYKSKIVGFDPSNMVISIESTGKLKNGAKSKMVSIYKLSNLYLDTTFDTINDPKPINMAAFKLAGNSDFESNCDVQVDGMCYIKSKLTVNSSNFKFNGPFYQEKNNNTSTTNGGSLYFGDRTYLGSPWDISSGTNTTFNGTVGFDNWVESHANSPTFNGDIYINGDKSTNWTHSALHLDWAKVWNAKHHDVYSVKSLYDNGQTTGDYLDQICKNVGYRERVTIKYNLDSILNFDTLPPDLEINDSILNSVKPYYTKPAPTLTRGSDLTALYYDAYANGDTLCGGFAVIREHPSWNGNPSDFVVKDNGSKIDGKIVYISTRSHNLRYFPSTTNDANVLLICNNTNNTTQFGVDYMRGVLFVNKAGIQVQPSNPTIIDGATYYGPSAQHYNNSGGGVWYKYNPDVLQEMACMGVIKSDDDTLQDSIFQVGDIELKIRSNASHIRASLLSRAYIY